MDYIFKGNGDEYQRLDAIKNLNAPLILPVNFPDAYDVSNPYAANMVALADMRHWNQAPSNPKVLADNNISFSFTAYDLKSPSKLKEKLMKAIKFGLSKTKALEALTTVPASILGKSGSIGSLQVGRQANFLITSGDIFEKGTTLYENWVQGNQNVINDKNLKDIRGNYDLSAGGMTYKMAITGEAGKPKLEVKQDTNKLKSKISYKDDWLNISFTTDKGEKNYRMTGLVNKTSDNISGKLVLPNGNESTFNVIKTSAHSEDKKDKKKDAKEPKRDEKVLNALLAGEKPLIAYADRATDILALIKLKQDFGLDLVIADAGDAVSVATQIAEAKVPVIIATIDNLPSFDALHQSLKSATVLMDAGVTVAFKVNGDTHNLYQLRYDAGVAIANGVSKEQALAAVTANVADAFNYDAGRIAVGKKADLVLWSADPFELSTRVEKMWIDGVEHNTESRQDALRDRYTTDSDMPRAYTK